VTDSHDAQGRPHGLMFHRFAPPAAGIEWQGALTPAQFEAILLQQGIDRILSPDEWIARLEADALEPGHLCVTFDDGLRCQMDEALPVLERYGLRAFWFVYSCVFDGHPVRSEIYSYVAGRCGGMEPLMAEFFERCPPSMIAHLETSEYRDYAAALARVAPFYSTRDVEYRFLRNRVESSDTFEGVMDDLIRGHGYDVADVSGVLWLDENDVRRLSDAGHAIGLHSYNHPYDVASLTRAEQYAQYARNHEQIGAATGKAPVSMSHPLNSYNADSLGVLRELGIRCGFRATMSPPAGRPPNPDPLALPREDSTNLLGEQI
jgi:peptidoglycan/xylan/chitin deacetylase (PgdA/CDA1 family)